MFGGGGWRSEEGGWWVGRGLGKTLWLMVGVYWQWKSMISQKEEERRGCIALYNRQ